MSRRIAHVVACALLLGLFSDRAHAGPLVDFEAFSDGDMLTTQLADFTFTNAMVLTAGVSLNELAFPPHSGSNVIFDSGGALRIDFAAGQDLFSGYFTYAAPLILQAFDASNTLLGTVNSTFSSNLFDFGTGTGGNELLALAFSNMAYVTILGDPSGGSFTLDDMSTEPALNPVPEPGTLVLFGLGSLVMIRKVRAHASRRA